MNEIATSGPPPVTVTVSNLTDPPTITCTPSTVVITEPNSLLVFNLVTEGYVFPTSGAIIVQGGAAEFPNLWYISAAEVALHDLCEVPAEYNYTVVVEEASTGRRFKVDPKIRNEPV